MSRQELYQVCALNPSVADVWQMQFWAKMWHLCHTCCSTGIPKSGYLGTRCKSATVSFQRTAVGDFQWETSLTPPALCLFSPVLPNLPEPLQQSNGRQFSRKRHTKWAAKYISKLKAKEDVRKNLQPFRKWSYCLGWGGGRGGWQGFWGKDEAAQSCGLREQVKKPVMTLKLTAKCSWKGCQIGRGAGRAPKLCISLESVILAKSHNMHQKPVSNQKQDWTSGNAPRAWRKLQVNGHTGNSWLWGYRISSWSFKSSFLQLTSSSAREPMGGRSYAPFKTTRCSSCSLHKIGGSRLGIHERVTHGTLPLVVFPDTTEE